MESAFAKTTFCRKCSKHFDLEQQREAEAPATKDGLLKRFGTLFATETTRGIRCFDCRAQQNVSSSAKSSICPQCGAYIDLRDFKIATSFARAIQTQGTVIVTPKGRTDELKGRLCRRSRLRKDSREPHLLRNHAHKV